MKTLDVSTLRRNYWWNNEVRLDGIVYGARPIIDAMMASGLIATRESFGYALAVPDCQLSDVWDDPTELIAFVVYWGPKGMRCAANAIRKIRAAARNNQDTEVLRREHPDLFQDVVDSQEPDGSFAWGDFPFDGAAYCDIQGRRLLGSVSTLPKEQDPIVARLITGLIGLAIFEQGKLQTA